MTTFDFLLSLDGIYITRLDTEVRQHFFYLSAWCLSPIWSQESSDVDLEMLSLCTRFGSFEQ